MKIFEQIYSTVTHLENLSLTRQRQEVNVDSENRVTIGEQHYINSSSNDYLGLAQDPRIKEWYKTNIDKYGCSGSSSQLICGYTSAHRQLEQAIADFFGREDALLFSSGYLANLSIASSIIDNKTFVFQDKKCHASLIDAARLSDGKLVRYRHNDMTHLSSLLKKYKPEKSILMTDGIFSMDGDKAKLKELIEISRQYESLLLVDDAHGIATIGDTGGGLLQQQSCSQQDIPLLTGTFGKAFGMSGAFVAGDKRLINVMQQQSRSYIYTTALPPATAATLIQVIALVKESKKLREQLITNIATFKQGLNKETGSDTHIQPIIIGNNEKTITAGKQLMDKGLFTVCIRPPTVEKNSSRIRISLSAAHTALQLKKLTDSLNQVIN